MRSHVAFVLALCLTGCRQQQPPRKPVIAVVDGSPIEWDEFQSELRNTRASIKTPAALSQSLEGDIAKVVLDRMIEDRRLLTLAASLNMPVNLPPAGNRSGFFRTLRTNVQERIVAPVSDAALEAELGRLLATTVLIRQFTVKETPAHVRKQLQSRDFREVAAKLTGDSKAAQVQIAVLDKMPADLRSQLVTLEPGKVAHSKIGDALVVAQKEAADRLSPSDIERVRETVRSRLENERRKRAKEELARRMNNVRVERTTTPLS